MQRSEVSSLIYQNIIQSNDNGKKDILQNIIIEIPFADRLSRDYLKEQAMIKSKIRDKIISNTKKTPDTRKEISDYY